MHCPAGTRIANPDPGQAKAYRRILGAETCYLNLSEGADDTIRDWFYRLRPREAPGR